MYEGGAELIREVVVAASECSAPFPRCIKLARPGTGGTSPLFATDDRTETGWKKLAIVGESAATCSGMELRVVLEAAILCISCESKNGAVGSVAGS